MWPGKNVLGQAEHQAPGRTGVAFVARCLGLPIAFWPLGFKPHPPWPGPDGLLSIMQSIGRGEGGRECSSTLPALVSPSVNLRLSLAFLAAETTTLPGCKASQGRSAPATCGSASCVPVGSGQELLPGLWSGPCSRSLGLPGCWDWQCPCRHWPVRSLLYTRGNRAQREGTQPRSPSGSVGLLGPKSPCPDPLIPP